MTGDVRGPTSVIAIMCNNSDDFLIALPPVGIQTAAAILLAVRTDQKAAFAPGAQQIEGTVAEETVEILRVRPWVAGEVFTIPVGKI